MYKQCKTEQSAARQRELEEGLLSSMSSEHYEEISVSDLCARIGIPRKAFYRYFSGKDGALYALIDHTLLEFDGYQKPVQTGKPRDYQEELEYFFRFWFQKKRLLDALLRSNMSGVLVMRSIEQAVSEAGMPVSLLPKEDRNARQHAIRFGVCGLMSMVLQWHHNGYDLSIKQMAAISVKLLTEPLFSRFDLY